MKYVFLIEPVPASRPRVTRYGVHYPATYEQFRRDMGKLMLKVPQTLIPGPVRTDVTFYVRAPGSLSNKKRTEMDGQFCISTFDIDNLEKALYDSLTGRVWVDDKQVVEHHVRKIWSKENPRIEITIEEIHESS